MIARRSPAAARRDSRGSAFRGTFGWGHNAGMAEGGWSRILVGVLVLTGGDIQAG